nr:pectin acetylesterase [Lachnospiraceae bacterium]
LYSSSIYDYLLSSYYNDIKNKKYETNEEIQQEFYEQLKLMVSELKDITDKFTIFLNDWKIPLITMGGTVHTSVREHYFTLFTQDGITMSNWLHDAVNGRIYDVGMNLIK